MRRRRLRALSRWNRFKRRPGRENGHRQLLRSFNSGNPTGATIDQIRILAGDSGAITIESPPLSLLQPSWADRNWHNVMLKPSLADRNFNRLTQYVILLELDASERRSRGDLTGAWDDILAQYRIAIQYARGADSLVQAESAYRLAARNVPQVLAWARDPRLTWEQIQVARSALADLTWPDLDEAIRGQSRLLEQELDRPTEEWVNYWAQPATAGGPDRVLERIYAAWVLVPSWERERTRRLLRIVTAITVHDDTNYPQSRARLRDRRSFALAELANAPSQAQIARFWPQEGTLYRKTPMADRVLNELVPTSFGATRELAERRALGLLLAIRNWQLTHNGNAPPSLDVLIDPRIEQLPVDPYSLQGATFTYFPIYGSNPVADAARAEPVNPDEPPTA